MALITVIKPLLPSVAPTVTYSELEALPNPSEIDIYHGDAIIINGIVYLFIPRSRYFSYPQCYAEILPKTLLSVSSEKLDELYLYWTGVTMGQLVELPEVWQQLGYLRIHRVS